MEGKNTSCNDPFSGKYIYDLVDVEIDEKTLKTIALETGGNILEQQTTTN